jgi:glucose dehydrogenase
LSVSKRRFLVTVVAAGALAVGVVSLASASPSASSKTSSVSAEAQWPWEPAGSVPAGTAGNDWQYPKGDLGDSQFSYLNQINAGNVSKLQIAWQQSFDPPNYLGEGQAVPIVVSGQGKNLPLASGTMFMAADSGVVAMDPTNGKILWQYIGPPPKPASPGGTPAQALIYGNAPKVQSFCNGMVIFGQQDGSVQALNAKTGAPIWTNQVSDVNEFTGHTGQAGPPVDCDPTAGANGDGLVFAGPNGSSSPLRGHLDAIDAKTGQLVWRWFTTPDPTQLPFILTWSNPAEAALGGGGLWGSSAIDSGLHMVYSESGNAYAQLGRQPGKDLWTASTFALNENTGQLVWYWQEAHHDNWDLDHGGMPTIENVKINGKTYPALFTCDKDGNCEVVNRSNGSPLPGFPMHEQPVQDPSGKGLALNNEYPTQPVSSCAPFTVAGLAHDDTGGVKAGSPCATANLLIHCPDQAEANLSYASLTAPNGSPMVPTCQFAATYSNQYNIFPTCSCGTSYARMSYDPMTNNQYVCANNQFTAQENVSPVDWHKNSISGPIISVWLDAVNMSNNTMSWQDRFNGATYVNGSLVGGSNSGFTQGTWSKGCYGGVMTTAGNLLFVDSWGDSSRGIPTNLPAGSYPWGGTLAAFNATTGAGPLWTWQAPDFINDSPMTYQIGGKQYVAVYHMLPLPGAPTFNGNSRDQLTVFALP